MRFCLVALVVLCALHMGCATTRDRKVQHYRSLASGAAAPAKTIQGIWRVPLPGFANYTSVCLESADQAYFSCSTYEETGNPDIPSIVAGGIRTAPGSYLLLNPGVRLNVTLAQDGNSYAFFDPRYNSTGYAYRLA